MPVRIRALERSDIRQGFSCGEPALDVFLERYAWQNQTRHHLGVTYVAVADESRHVLGYFTVSGAALSGEPGTALAPGGYAEVPVLRLARLAVDGRVRGVGLGGQLVRAALVIAVEQSERVGCTGVIVDAKPDAIEFYRQLGFRPLGVIIGGGATRPRLTQMLLGIDTIRRALAAE